MNMIKNYSDPVISCTQAIIPEGKSEEAKGQSSFAKAQAPHAKAFQSLYSLLGYSEQVF